MILLEKRFYCFSGFLQSNGERNQDSKKVTGIHVMPANRNYSTVEVYKMY